MTQTTRNRSFSFLALIISAVLTGSAVCLRAQSNLVLFNSLPGDYIGQGQIHVTTNLADFTFGGTPSGVSVGAFGYGFTFVPGAGTLDVGTYPGAVRYPFNGAQPGMDISGNGRGCNNECGTFQILEFHTNTSGQVDHYWMVYSNSCECFNSPMLGEIRFNSLLAPATPVPKTIRVPADVSTIQIAVLEASLLTTDTVLVSPGTYNESVNLSGRPVILTSSGGPAVTFIKPPTGANGLTFTSGETSNTVVSGFTILNNATGAGISSCSPTILSNIFIGGATGINSSFASPTVRSNVIAFCSGTAITIGGAASALFEGNQVRTNHGGVSMNAAGSPTFRNNIIQGNIGAGISMGNQSDANIIQNIIVENTGVGISWLVPSGARGPYVINNTIANNGGAGISADGYDINALIINNIIVGAPALSVGTFNDTNPPVVQYNDVFGSGGAPAYAGAIANLTGVSGNISLDPLFTCIPSHDYHLLASSPAIDAGSNGVTMLPVLDLDGNNRFQVGSSGAPTVDMGAFEFNPAAPPVPCIYINCPANVATNAPSGQLFAVVNYPAPTGAPIATITSVPPSGSPFPAGTNVVVCTATYGTNVAHCSFTVTVVTPPIFTNGPQTIDVSGGGSFSLTASPLGTPPFAYSWLFENSVISGATSNVLNIGNAQAVNEGIYRLVASNPAGSSTSAVMSVRVVPTPPTIVTNPSSVTVPATSNAVFSVAATGSQPFAYQWTLGGAPLAGATNSQLPLVSVQATNAGNYQVIVANGAGSVTSTVATLTVTPRAPVFTLQPVSAQIAAGTNFTFTGQANGSQPITYRWTLNGSAIAGATQTALSLTNVTPANNGTYMLVASNTVASVNSTAVSLIVIPVPQILQPLTNLVVDTGGNVLLSVVAGGSAPLGYVWQFNSGSLPGSSSSLTLSNIQPSQSGFYMVTVTNTRGSAVSASRVSVVGIPGLVNAWGDNSSGQCTEPGGLGAVVAVAGGDYHTTALFRNGSLAAWGNNGNGQTNVPTSALRFVAVASGAAHSLAINEAGTVLAWGRNDAGQCNVPFSTSNSVVAVAAGDSFSLALLNTGLVQGWGDNTFGQVSVPGGLTAVKAIAAGRQHALALRTNGTVTAWGYNAYGQASPPAGMSNVVAIAGGYLHSVALLSNGTVAAWGDNSFGQTNIPPAATNIVGISAGDLHTLALRGDGTVVAWGDNSVGQTAVPASLTNVLAVAAGNYHSLALTYAIGPLQIAQPGPPLILNWTGPGILQVSPSPAGPFTDVGTQGSPYTNLDVTSPSLFFRLRR